MKKSVLCRWKRQIRLAIVGASCLWTLSPPAQGQSAEETPRRLQEARIARESAEARNRELAEALARSRRELVKIRVRYADLFLASQEQRDDLERLELRVAHLLNDRGDARAEELAAEAFRSMDQVQQRQYRMAELIRGFGVYLDSVLGVLRASDTLRQEVEERYGEIREAAVRTLKPLPLVAGRGRWKSSGGKCRILALNDDLQLAVLDCGRDRRVRPGSEWQVYRDGEPVARLKVIEVRTRISAAMIQDGSLDAIGIGDEVVPSAQTRPAAKSE